MADFVEAFEAITQAIRVLPISNLSHPHHPGLAISKADLYCYLSCVIAPTCEEGYTGDSPNHLADSYAAVLRTHLGEGVS